jgi:hypothetical protein
MRSREAVIDYEAVTLRRRPERKRSRLIQALATMCSWATMNLTALCLCLAKGQCIRLGKEVGHELVMVGDAAGHLHGRRGLDVANELAVGRAALMQQLIERVLAVGARLAEDKLAHGIGKHVPDRGHALAVRLHVNLQAPRRARLSNVRRHR